MRRHRAKPPLSVIRARAANLHWLAAALMFAALVLGLHAAAAAPRGATPSAPSLHVGSIPHAVDAVLPRHQSSLKRDRVWLDLPVVPPAPGARIVPHWATA